jgi:hypothetical protein
MNDLWRERVSTTIDSLMEQMRVETSDVNVAGVQESMDPLVQTLHALEEKIAERDELLRAPDAPADGLNLTEKLENTHDVDDAHLADRCRQVAVLISNANHRAISLFVCQYHLADFGSEIVRLLAGAAVPPTYGSDDVVVRGGLFNESA